MYDKMKGGNEKMGCYGECSSGSCVTVQPRGFLTKQEKIEMLKEYKGELENEAQGVAERIAELEKED